MFTATEATTAPEEAPRREVLGDCAGVSLVVFLRVCRMHRQLTCMRGILLCSFLTSSGIAGVACSY